VTPMDPDGESVERAPDSPALAAWRRRMWRACFALMPLGLLLVIVGAATAWGATPLVGFALGGAGLFAIVLGALFGKFAAAGPFPEGLR
jgi:hypothetical protein